MRLNKIKRIDFIVDTYSALPANEFVEAVNKAYYEIESNKYDSAHPDIYYDAADAWRKIGRSLRTGILDTRDYTVADIGSGTGFVASCFLSENIPFYRYVGFEPSPEMRSIAKNKYKYSSITFCGFDLTSKNPVGEALGAINGKKIITLNSVLHHIVWWEDFLLAIRNALNDGDILILCHEPNINFYNNSTLISYYNRIEKENAQKERLRFYLDIGNYIKKAQRMVNLGGFPKPSHYDSIVTILNASGILKKNIEPVLVDAIIDYGVPLCWRSIIHEIKDYDEGFYSVDSLMKNYFSDFKIIYECTYQHLGFSPDLLSKKWKHIARKMEIKYPDDGAQFCLAIYR